MVVQDFGDLRHSLLQLVPVVLVDEDLTHDDVQELGNNRFRHFMSCLSAQAAVVANNCGLLSGLCDLILLLEQCEY